MATHCARKSRIVFWWRVTEREFLDAIVRSPDDDELRRVFADWLDERGDVRGEFVRLQLANDARAEEHIETHWRAFAGELAPWSNESSFKRGLVDRVVMTPAALEAEGAWIFSKYPVSTLALDAPEFTDQDLEQVVNAPAMSHVRALNLEIERTSPRRRLAPLAKGARFDSLKSLQFIHCGHSAEDWSALFTHLDAPLLENVELRRCHSHSVSWRVLASNPTFQNLKSVHDQPVTALPGSSEQEIADALRLMADQRPKLQRLYLSRLHPLDDAAVAPLFADASSISTACA